MVLFPLALAIKSPILFLLFVMVGMVLLWHRTRRQRTWHLCIPAVSAIALLVVNLPSHLNIGVRHILPIYALLAIVGGYGAAQLWHLARFRLAGHVVVVALLLWQVTSSVRVHPDYLAYFNELAGRHPERILVVSDLDWGQDLKRLADELRARRVEQVSIAYAGSADLSQHGLPPFRQLLPHQPTVGWIAISELALKTYGNGGYAWLEAYEPVTRVGRSIRLYYLPEDGQIVAKKGARH
jgi:hypothetical protein